MLRLYEAVFTEEGLSERTEALIRSCHLHLFKTALNHRAQRLGQAAHEIFEADKIQGLRPIRERPLWTGVHLDDESISA